VVDLISGIPEPLKATDRDGMVARMAPSLFQGLATGTIYPRGVVLSTLLRRLTRAAIL
jgi:hypothetical protein